MYKRGRKMCSTPITIESGSTSLSTSDVKNSSSSGAPPTTTIGKKRLERSKVNGKRRKRKPKHQKIKEHVQKIKRKKCIESRMLNRGWETPNFLDDNYNKDEATFHLFESPERVRDLGVEKDYVLSPPLIGPRESSLPVIESRTVDKEEVLFFGANKIETDDSFLTFDRSKVVRTYASMKKKKWKKRLLKNKGSGEWLVNVKTPTASADSLWENYIKNNSIQLPQSQINDIEKNEPWDEHNDKDNAAISDEILAMLSEERRQLLKSKRLCRIKGSCSKKSEVLSADVREFVYVPGDDKLPLKQGAHKTKKRGIKWIETKRNEFNDFSRSVSYADCDLRKENGIRMTFNEFHERFRREKEKKDIDYLGQKIPGIRIKSMVEHNAVVYKRSDGNFGIVKN